MAVLNLFGGIYRLGSRMTGGPEAGWAAPHHAKIAWQGSQLKSTQLARPFSTITEKRAGSLPVEFKYPKMIMFKGEWKGWAERISR
jgi:hypothetical protein